MATEALHPPQPLFYPRLIRRARAFMFDSVLLPVAVFASLIAGDAAGLSPTWGKVLLIALPIFVLEPLLVALTGGTVGHHLVGLKVTPLSGQGRIGILAATLRFLVKLPLGWLSLMFVLTTRKHQAVHDLVARSIVIHRESAGLPAYDLLAERQPDPQYRYPPAWRRLLVILAYFIAMSFLLNGVSTPLVGEGCLVAHRCTLGEQLVEAISSLVWLIATGWIVVKGWGGRLHGCRRQAKEPVQR